MTTRAEERQVLFKRKPFALLQPPNDIPEHAEVWVMRGTNEVFVDYEKYLKRYDYLMQRKFGNESNGKSGMTYFEAFDSEKTTQANIDSAFPEVLREPILRKVQFSVISRIDDLVNAVYNEFKHDFFPGEEVMIPVLENEENMTGVIREKAKFPQICGPNGEIQRKAFSRYFVRLHNTFHEEALLDDSHIRRDRRVFTKQNLRVFLKSCLQREQWIGAPWLVKEPLAVQYKLPMEIPVHLLLDAKILADKQRMLMRVDKPPPRKRARTFEDERDQLRHRETMQQQGGAPAQLMPPGPNGQHAGRHPARPQPPLPPKYPIEDLDVLPKRDGVVRPELEFWTEEQAHHVKEGRRKAISGFDMASVGYLLEVWNTLNVQCEVYVLDSFTFDDFVDAMQYTATEPRCELLDEVHCAVLKLMVDAKGKVTLSKGALPDMVAETEESSSEDPQDESELSTPLPDAPARSTRSRLSQVEPSKSPTGAAEKVHRAAEMLGDRDWISRLANREFEDGGWQIILVGLLHQLSSSPRYKSRCNAVLSWLAPMDEEPTPETAHSQYASMSINLRASALQMITILSIATPAVKEFLETCSEDMTDVRKKKIEWQRQKKIAFEELQYKDRERRIQLPDNMPESPKEEGSAEAMSTNGDADSPIEVSGSSSPDPDDDKPSNTRLLRRGLDRKRKRDKENLRLAEAKKRAEEAKQQPKQSKEFKKLVAECDELRAKILDLEAKISDCDADLREANVQRTKVLGKDRFCNRYYWFERNGQPFGGLPTSSTASYGYANGRIWVQGPDEMEREGFIDRTPEDQKAYQSDFGTTVPGRRRLEEGLTYLQSAQEWGYYDNPAVLDNLIGWLDDRGERERKLRKELIDWRDTIAEYMDAYKKFKDEEAAKKVEADEENANRISTRHKAQEEQTAAKERCLRWENTMAAEQLGHIHSLPERPKPKPVKVQLRATKGVAIPINRHGKPVTRQG